MIIYLIIATIVAIVIFLFLSITFIKVSDINKVEFLDNEWLYYIIVFILLLISCSIIGLLFPIVIIFLIINTLEKST